MSPPVVKENVIPEACSASALCVGRADYAGGPRAHENQAVITQWMETRTICKYNNFNRITANGGMREWLKRAVLKTAVPERVSGVRIPLPPPLIR